MEVTQFTYFQQAGGKMLDVPAVEITYGMERIIMALQVGGQVCVPCCVVKQGGLVAKQGGGCVDWRAREIARVGMLMWRGAGHA